MTAAFDPAHLRRFFASLARVTRRLEQRWLQAAASGETLEMKMALAMLARRFELLDVGTVSGAAPAERMAFTAHPVGSRMRVAGRRSPGQTASA